MLSDEMSGQVSSFHMILVCLEYFTDEQYFQGWKAKFVHLNKEAVPSVVAWAANSDDEDLASSWCKRPCDHTIVREPVCSLAHPPTCSLLRAASYSAARCLPSTAAGNCRCSV